MNWLSLFLVLSVYFSEPLRRHTTMRNIKCMVMLVSTAGTQCLVQSTVPPQQPWCRASREYPAVKKMCIIYTSNNSSSLKSHKLPGTQVPGLPFQCLWTCLKGRICRHHLHVWRETWWNSWLSEITVQLRLIEWARRRGHGDQPRADVAPHVVLSGLASGDSLRSRSQLFWILRNALELVLASFLLR